MLLSNMTWMEVRDLLPNEPILIQPVGSTEQHGPHMPLQVDITSAYEVAKEVGERTGCLIAPPLPYGYSELWDNFPGTISFTAQTFMTCVAEITESLVRNGFKKIFFLNGHNPNLPLLQTSMFQLMDRYGRRGDMLFAAGSYFLMNKEACDEIGDNFREGTHANEFETAFMMHLRPDMVYLDRLGDWEYKPELILSYLHGVTSVVRLPDSECHNGVYGDPRRATPEKGQLYFEACVSRVVEIVENFTPEYFGFQEVY
jgi:creatinine amidohydrolase